MRNRAYASLAESLKNAPNFPPFVNDSGPDCIEKAKEVLEKRYDANQPPSADVNRRAVQAAIWELDKYRQPEKHIWSIDYETTVRRERLRVRACKALLYFMMDDSERAYAAAIDADRVHILDDGNRDLILFIRGTSGLLAQKLNLNESRRFVDAAIASGKDNPLMPLLFSIYLSRVDALGMMTPEFLESFASNLYGLPKETSQSCYAFVAMYVLKQMDSYVNAILAMDQNKHLLTAQNIDEAIRFCEQTYKSFTRLSSFAGNLYLRMPSDAPKDGGESFTAKFRKAVSGLSEKDGQLQQTVNELKALRNTLGSTPAAAFTSQTPAGTRSSGSAEDFDLAPIFWNLGILLFLFMLGTRRNRKMQNNEVEQKDKEEEQKK